MERSRELPIQDHDDVVDVPISIRTNGFQATSQEAPTKRHDIFVPTEKAEKAPERTQIAVETAQETETEPKPEQQEHLREAAINALKQQAENIEQEALARKLWKRVEQVSNAYNKIPFKYKMLVAAGLGATSVVASGAVAAGVAGALIAQRIAGGAATAVAVESLLAKATEDGGVERTKKQVMFHRTMGLVAGGIVGSGQLAEGLSYAGDKIGDGYSFLMSQLSERTSETYVENTGDMAFAHSTPVHVDVAGESPPMDDATPLTESSESSLENTASEVQETLEAASESSSEILYTVPEGGTVWNGIKTELESRGMLEGLNPQAQNDLIDVYENKVTNLPPDALKELGISSGNAHLVHAGETVNLTSIFEDVQNNPPAWVDTTFNTPQVVDEAEAPLEQAVKETPVTPPTESVVDAMHTKGGLEEVSTAPETSAPQYSEMPATEQSPASFTLDNLSAGTSENMSLMPEALAEESLNQDLDELFGHMGVGRTLANPVVGADSVHWVGPSGLSTKYVGELMKLDPSTLDIAGKGVDSSEAVRAIQEKLKILAESAGTTFRADETVKDYMLRAHENMNSST